MSAGAPREPAAGSYGHEQGDPDRNETAAQKIDRNFDDLLQETRVVQTGIQVLFAFLLVVPFQARFPELTAPQRTLYLIVLFLVALSTTLALGPVVIHRLLFGRRVKDEILGVSHRLLLIALGLLGLSLIGGLALVVDMVLGITATLIAAALLAAVIAFAWLIVPRSLRRKARESPPD